MSISAGQSIWVWVQFSRGSCFHGVTQCNTALHWWWFMDNKGAVVQRNEIYWALAPQIIVVSEENKENNITRRVLLKRKYKSRCFFWDSSAGSCGCAPKLKKDPGAFAGESTPPNIVTSPASTGAYFLRGKGFLWLTYEPAHRREITLRSDRIYCISSLISVWPEARWVWERCSMQKAFICLCYKHNAV